VTIAVGVACPEGVVLAADSRTSFLSPAGAFRVATDYAHKVFAIGRAFAAVTYGWAFLEGKTIAGVMEEFVAQTPLPDTATIDDVAQALSDYFKQRFDNHVGAGKDPAPPAGSDALGFIVGGYDASGVGRLKLVGTPTEQIVAGAATDACGAHWQGETDVFVRLIKGYDVLRLVTRGWPQPQLDALAALEYVVRFEAMALQDAVDYGEFVVRTTIDMQRFSYGTFGTPGEGFPSCGGPVEIATITWGGGVEWVRQTSLRAASPGRAEGARE
jgi:hypothetical protein